MMKKFLKTLMTGVMLTSLIPATTNAIEFDVEDRSEYYYNSSYSNSCIMSIRALTIGKTTDAVLWGYYPVDYFTVIVEDGDGDIVGRLNSFWRNGESGYSNPDIWIKINPVQFTGPFTVKFYDTDSSAFVPGELKGEFTVDTQTLIDVGGLCAQAATGIINTAPVADAGDDILGALPNHVVFLDGTMSSDVDDDDLTYQWRQIEGPVVMLDDPTSATPTFIYPPLRAHEILSFELVVNDGTENSEPDTITVIHNGRSNGQAKGRQ